MLFTAWAVELWAGRIVFASEEERCRKLLQGLDVDCKDKVNGSFTCVLIMHFTVFHIICTILSFTHQWDLSLHCKLCLGCEGFTVHKHTIHFTVILITRIITFLFLTNFAAFLILKIYFLDYLPQPICSGYQIKDAQPLATSRLGKGTPGVFIIVK